MGIDVLIVDDDADLRSTLSELLHEEGFQTLELPDTTDLVKVLLRIRPRVLLLDLTMPGTDMRTTVRNATDLGCFRDTTVLAMSGLSDAQEVARSLGFHGVIPKPFDVSALLGTSSSICRPARSPRTDQGTDAQS